jgi:uncharacterized protein YdaT
MKGEATAQKDVVSVVASRRVPRVRQKSKDTYTNANESEIKAFVETGGL